MANLVYKTKGAQLSFYRLPNGTLIHGSHLEDGTELFLRNRACHLHEDKPNVFEIASEDDHDIYLFLNADQVEYVSGNIGINSNSIE